MASEIGFSTRAQDKRYLIMLRVLHRVCKKD